jgi:NAD-dependent DNA ligase
LLSNFGSVGAIAAASLDELQNVDGIGPERARAIHDLFHRRYLATGGDAAREATLEGGDGAARGEAAHAHAHARQIVLEEATRLPLLTAGTSKDTMLAVESRQPDPLRSGSGAS